MKIVVRSNDYAGNVRKSWTAKLLEQDGSLLILRGVFEAEVSHTQLGRIQAGTVSYEYYWLDRWYNVFRFHEPDGTFKCFYCNLNMPPVESDAALDYVDLEIDLLVDPTGSILVLDEDEFEQSRLSFGYPNDLVETTHSALEELMGLIERREFPFDFLNSLQQKG